MSTALCAIVLLLSALPAQAQDWESWAARSDRSLDTIFLQAMEKGDLEVGIAICKGLGRRSDADVQAELGPLLSQVNPALPPADSEVMLRWLIASAASAHPGDDALRAWEAANAPCVDEMLERISRWKDAQLKRDLLRLAIIAPAPHGTTAIMEIGLQLLQELEVSEDGLLSPQDTALGMDFLSAARSAGDRAFLDPCVQLARLSRDKDLVDAARAAARGLSSAR